MGTESLGPGGDGAGAREPRGDLAALLQRGRRALEAGDWASAHAEFGRAHGLDLNHPAAMSFYGLTLTLLEHEHDKGILLCEEAVRRAGAQPDLLVNLGRAYIAARQKRQAARVLTQAARAAPGHPGAEQAWEQLGRRRKPVLRWLPRSFFLNRWLGRLRYRWLKWRGKIEED